MRRFPRLIVPGLVIGLLLLPTALAWLDAARAASGKRYAYRAAPRRVVVLGFDGVDPKILREYMGELPALRSLAETGSFLPCRTTNPPESPVAWATFATGLNPGDHGVFDFVRRDPQGKDSYQPLNGMVQRVPPEINALGIPVRPPAAINLRGGEGFWEPVAREGYRVSVLRMPLTFPAKLGRGGELLCGLGVPDLRATNGSYTLFAAGRDAWQGHTVFGGRHIKIYPEGGVATAPLEGPPDVRRPGSGKRLSVPLRFLFAGESAAVAVDGGRAVSLEPGLYTRWIKVRFSAGPLVRVDGLVRFLLLRTGKEPAIYASPIQISPHNPPLPISAPGDFAAKLADRLGPMKTSGWPEDTFAANDRVIDDVQLFDEIRDTYLAHERLCLDRLDRSDAALLTMVFTAQDRMSHMYFRYRDRGHPARNEKQIADFVARTGVKDPILEAYRWMDQTVGKVLARLGPDDIFILVSDHGFHSFRYGFNLNSWLWRQNMLALADTAARKRKRRLKEFFGSGSPTDHIDWDRTQAYAMGLGQIYLNLKGRESNGTVDPANKDAVLARIVKLLEGLEGPDGKPVFTRIYRGEEIFHGSRMAAAPDLQCAFAEGYRISWQTALLGVPEPLFEVNSYPWSGDHCSNDASQTAGVFLSNRKLPAGTSPGLDDIAPTVCKLFGAPPPPETTGSALPLANDGR
ncbi:MAG: alkaline phosphatase family protein [Planctomycetota bacterium]